MRKTELSRMNWMVFQLVRSAMREAALAATQVKTAQSSLEQVEAQHGAEAVRVVLTREAEVTKTWDALLEARGDKK